MLQAGGTHRGFYACSLASPEQIRCPDRWAHSRYLIKDCSLHPTLPQSGGSATPSQLFQVPESQPGALLTIAPSPPSHGTNRGPVTYFLQWGHLPGPLACPWATLAALQLVEKLTAPLRRWKGPKRDWLLPKLLEGQTGEWPPQPATRGWGPALPLLCPRPFWVLRTCLPTPAKTRAAFAQTCFMDWRCGLGKWGPKEWVAEIKAGLVGGGHSLLPPLLPTVCQVPQPCPSCPTILPFPSLPSLQLGSGLNLPSWLLGPASSSASCLQSPAPVHPHKR